MCPEVLVSEEALFSILLRPQNIHRMALSSYVLETLNVLQQKILAPRFYHTAKLIRGKILADMHSRLVLSILRS